MTNTEKSTSLVPQEVIAAKILLIRGMKVILDRNLAELYGVETRRLNEQVRRNIKRFPDDFMFQLTEEEFKNLKSHFATSSWGGVRKLPYAFTEYGALMLANVIKSPTAIEMSIAVVRAFTKVREILATHADVRKRIEEHDEHIKAIFDVLKQLLEPPEEPKELIGFKR
jgi:phage regulator Rha-like protein